MSQQSFPHGTSSVAQQLFDRVRPHLPLLAITAFVIGALAAPAAAQTQVIRPPVTGDGQMADIATRVVPYVKDIVERLTLRRFVFLATILAQLVMAGSFIKLMLDNPGVSRHLFNWSGRWLFFLPLIVLGPFLVSYLWQLGQVLTTPLLQPVEVVRQSFDQRYKIYVRGNFLAVAENGTVWERINVNNDMPRPESGAGVLIGVLRNNIPDTKSIEEMLKDDKKNLPLYFGIISAGRGVILFVDFILVAISGFLMIAFRLAVPWMCAVGGDKQLANEVTYRFARGVIVYTLVYPVVANVMRIIAYLFGLVGMSSYSLVAANTAPGFGVTPGSVMPFPFDPAFSSVYALGIAGFFMLVTALCLALSPVVAWKIAFGQTFEGVSQVASGWMAGITGSAMNFVSAKLGAALNYDAEKAMVNAQADAGIIGARAEASRDVTMQRLGLRKETAGIDAAAQNTIALNNASTTKEVRGFQAQLQAEIKTNAANRTAAQRGYDLAGDAKGMDTRLAGWKERAMAEATMEVSTRMADAGMASSGASGAAQIAGGLLSLRRGGGAYAGSQLGQAGGNIIGSSVVTDTQKQAAGYTKEFTDNVTHEVTLQTQLNAMQIAEKQRAMEDVRYGALTEAAQDRTGAQVGAAHGYNRTANAAARTYAGTQVGAAEAYAGGAIEATGARLTESERAIETVRRAGEYAAENHRMAQILGSMTNDIARRIEETGAYRGF